MNYKKHLESINATIMSNTSITELENYIPEFVSITWLQDIQDTDKFLKSRDMSRLDCVREMFNWRTLPTALETVRVTFFLEGLDLTNVTHIIRHRLFSFSAQSTDPVSMEDHDILTNSAFDEHKDLAERAKKLTLESNELYKDALNRGISFYDARHYQPRAKEAKYFMSGNIKDFIGFINTRLGRTNQPDSDNILALKMRQQLLKAYPDVKDILEKQMPTEKIQQHYISSINNKMNMNTFPPDSFHKKELDKRNIDYSSAKFSHSQAKDTLSNHNYFLKIFNEVLNEK